MVVDEADCGGKRSIGGEVSLCYVGSTLRVGETSSLTSVHSIRVVGLRSLDLSKVDCTIVSGIVTDISGWAIGEGGEGVEAASRSLTSEDVGLSQGGSEKKEGRIQHVGEGNECGGLF